MTFLETLRKSNNAFIFLASFISVSLFLKPGFLTASVILFSIYCFFNFDSNLRHQIKLHKILILPFFLFFLYVIGTFFAFSFEEASIQIIKKIPLFLLPVCFFFLNKKISEREVQIILVFFLIGCLLFSIICVGYAMGNIIQYKSLGNEEGYYFSYVALTRAIDIDPIYLSMYCNFALVIALTTPLIEISWVRHGIVLFLCVFILMVASKMGIVTLVCVAMLWILTRPGKMVPKYILMTTLLLMLLIGIFELPFLRNRFITSTKFDYSELNGGLWNSTTFRLAIWSSAWEAIKKRPVLGYGTSNGQKALESVYHEKNFVWGLKHSYNAHNEFLSATLDLGILGLWAVSAMIIFPLIRSIQSKDMLTISFVMIVFLYLLIETMLLRQKGVIFFSFFYSLLFWHLNSWERLSADRNSPLKEQ